MHIFEIEIFFSYFIFNHRKFIIYPLYNNYHYTL